MAPSAAAYWNVRDIQFHCRIGRSTAWRLVRQDGFPAPVLCGARCVIWPRVEVIEFLEARRAPDHYRQRETKLSHQVPGSAVGFVARPVRSRATRGIQGVGKAATGGETNGVSP